MKETVPQFFVKEPSQESLVSTSTNKVINLSPSKFGLEGAPPKSEEIIEEDPRALLNKDIQTIKASMKVLKEYGLEWLIDWSKTMNFREFARDQKGLLCARSVNSPFVRGHFWFYENGDLYLGGLQDGKREGRPFLKSVSIVW